jgi:iron(III) transport system substrate-binding protein
MRASAPIAILCAVLALAACGDSDEGGSSGFENVAEQVEGLQGPAREDKLRELAREEGAELRFYTSLNDRAYRALLAPFEKRYGIDVTVFRSEGEPVAERVSQEAKAGRHGADVVSVAGSQHAGLARDGIFERYEPAAAGLPAEARHDGWTETMQLVHVVAWNRERVPRGQEPRSLEELAEPRWRGRVGLEASASDWYKTVREHWIEEGRSEEEADRLFEGIARNARVASSYAVMTELLGAGDFDVVATDYRHLVARIAGEGAPITFEPLVEPVYTRSNGVAIVKDAEHPASAMLLVDWILGEGQKAIERGGYVPVREHDRIEGRRVPIDVEAYADEAREWQDRYDELLRLTGRGG